MEKDILWIRCAAVAPYFFPFFLSDKSGPDGEIVYKALELAGLTGKETVVDAYCGIGTIGIIASKRPEM